MTHLRRNGASLCGKSIDAILALRHRMMEDKGFCTCGECWLAMGPHWIARYHWKTDSSFNATSHVENSPQELVRWLKGMPNNINVTRVYVEGERP
jgi:hypothetical protein